MDTSTSRLIALLGAAAILASLAACLGFAELREGRRLSLGDLERKHATLMSCAHDDAPASGTEALLWCGDASSPLCLPALPASGHIELADSPPLAFWSYALEIAPVLSWALPTWERSLPSREPYKQDKPRLERPPRA